VKPSTGYMRIFVRLSEERAAATHSSWQIVCVCVGGGGSRTYDIIPVVTRRHSAPVPVSSTLPHSSTEIWTWTRRQPLRVASVTRIRFHPPKKEHVTKLSACIRQSSKLRERAEISVLHSHSESRSEITQCRLEEVSGRFGGTVIIFRIEG
jgi:hypothetical protein